MRWLCHAPRSLPARHAMPAGRDGTDPRRDAVGGCGGGGGRHECGSVGFGISLVRWEDRFNWDSFGFGGGGRMAAVSGRGTCFWKLLRVEGRVGTSWDG